MASEDKASFPDGFDILSPKLKKRKVSCDSEICAICQVERPCETLRKGKESSVDKASRQDEMAPSLVGHFGQGWPQWIGLSV